MAETGKRVVKKAGNLNLLNLEYFLIAAEELNFTRAAGRLHIAQQSLSNHITKLEEHFETPLFDRTPPMSLTPAGLCFQRHARLLCQSLDEMELEIQDIKDFKSSEITLGITPARGACYLPMLLPKFRAAFPSMKVNVVEGNAEQLEQLLSEARVDLIIGRYPKNPLGLTCELVWKEQYVLIVPQNLLETYLPDRWEELCAHPEKAGLKDFGALPFLASQKDLHTGTIFHSCCSKAGITPNIVLESKNINITLSLCFEGMGALVCPNSFLHPFRYQLRTQRTPRLFVFPLHYNDDIMVSYLSGKYFPVGAQKFKEMIQEVGAVISNQPVWEDQFLTEKRGIP
ncbi:LysR family transcriptional regulator [Pseudoflavonifractor sp. 60]|uniref:LysR family transcriptional regulator n=1 Tax=Pseudoflavonifractor sp. 60 TaxID=2304576 RepID=UPI00136F6AAD|nr:LysR family transcriptional regulator [Pseudoflavonifractor sp. 60]MCI8914606.1 LysR family transcriptional regulator [Lawsonibacter sp.]NBI68860.1 LysR family transcriptional regulator [Pseudoflavonifractor sp. 60]